MDTNNTATVKAATPNLPKIEPLKFDLREIPSADGSRKYYGLTVIEAASGEVVRVGFRGKAVSLNADACHAIWSALMSAGVKPGDPAEKIFRNAALKLNEMRPSVKKAVSHSLGVDLSV